MTALFRALHPPNSVFVYFINDLCSVEWNELEHKFTKWYQIKTDIESLNAIKYCPTQELLAIRPFIRDGVNDSKFVYLDSLYFLNLQVIIAQAIPAPQHLALPRAGNVSQVTIALRDPVGLHLVTRAHIARRLDSALQQEIVPLVSMLLKYRIL